MKGGAYSKLAKTEQQLRQLYVRLQLVGAESSAAIAAELDTATDELEAVIRHVAHIEMMAREELQTDGQTGRPAA